MILKTAIHIGIFTKTLSWQIIIRAHVLSIPIGMAFDAKGIITSLKQAGIAS